MKSHIGLELGSPLKNVLCTLLMNGIIKVQQGTVCVLHAQLTRTDGVQKSCVLNDSLRGSLLFQRVLNLPSKSASPQWRHKQLPI
jgi:hypothetical protein